MHMAVSFYQMWLDLRSRLITLIAVSRLFEEDANQRLPRSGESTTEIVIAAEALQDLRLYRAKRQLQDGAW
jgi:hypothetical protein